MKTLAALILAVIFAFAPLVAYADKSTTQTYSQSRLFGLSRTQDAYLPGFNISNLGLRNPSSMAMCASDMLFIADTDNRRIVVFDTSTTEVVMYIEHPGFTSPRGVFVTADDILYVADASAGAVFMLTTQGEYIRTFLEPSDMPLMEIPFAPVRIAVDGRGNMYIVGEGVFNGIIHISNEGEFLGFFAANHTNLTMLQRIQNIFFTERQLEGLMDRNPLTFSNVTVDSRGVVFTTTMGPSEALNGEGLKRHDMSGRNTITASTFGTAFNDVVVDGSGIVFVSDAGGAIRAFTNSGELIFMFTAQRGIGDGHEDIAGWFRQLQSIAITSGGDIWALDSGSGALQSFTPTEYALSIFAAINMFNRGMYDESGILWEEVLRRNQMSVIAHNGLGRTHLYRQQFDSAQEHFFLGGNQEYYSIAFWETRNIWLLTHLNTVLIVVLALALGAFIIRHGDKNKVIAGSIKTAKNNMMTNRFLGPVLFAFTMARHPIDSVYYMRLKQKGNYLGATIHLVIFFFAYMLYQTSRGFVVQFLSIENMDFVAIIGMFVGGFVLFVVSNYLVTSIKEGEGTLGDVYKLVCYMSLPLTIMLLANTAISHVITHNEVFLLGFIFWGGIAYFVAITWVGLMELHNYTFSVNLKSLIITVFFMLIAVVVLYIITILFAEVINFIDSIRWEVVFVVQQS